MPAWVKYTTLQDEPILVNLDNVGTLHWNENDKRVVRGAAQGASSLRCQVRRQSRPESRWCVFAIG